MKKTIKRLTTIFLSLFLAFVCLVAVYSTPVTSASSNSRSVSITNNTTNTNLTYTATLNQTNILVLLNNEQGKKKNKVLENAKKQGNDWVKNVFSLAETIQKGNVDWEKVGAEIIKDVIVGVMGIWGLDGVTDTVLNGLETLLTSGQAPLSEVQILSDNIDGNTGNRTYTANYEKIVYNIIYELNGGTNAETNPSTYTIETDTIRLENPTKTGYNFVCWNEGNIIPNGSTEHKTFTAKWETIEYTVTYKNTKGVTNPNKNEYTVEDEFSLQTLTDSPKIT